MMQMLQEIA